MSDIDDSQTLRHDQRIALKLFGHQVGGHSCILSLDKNTVCKPLIQRENDFYMTVPHQLLEYVPQYRGVIDVSVTQNAEGIQMFGIPTDEKSRECVDQTIMHAQRHKAGPETCCECKAPKRDEKEDSQVSRADELSNSWSRNCQIKHLNKLGHSNGSYSQKYILLENLTSRYRIPNILDLKMGTRQHGDDATEEKRLAQAEKCANSTSSELGFRLCGMQVYRTDTQKYHRRDKYFGRELKSANVPSILHEFLDDGYDFKNNLLRPIVQHLQKLQEILKEQNSYRFYSCSLLIMYEGCCHSDRYNSNKNVDIKLIDFAHTTHEGFPNDRLRHSGPDQGLLLGLQSLITMFSQMSDSLQC